MKTEHERLKRFLISKLSGDDLQRLRSFAKDAAIEDEPKELMKELLGVLQVALPPEVLKQARAILAKLVPDGGMDDVDKPDTGQFGGPNLDDAPMASDSAAASFENRWPSASRIEGEVANPNASVRGYA